MLKISIITVCYNSAKTIEQTIKSVINQPYDNIEYIIIDGGSTDGTIELVNKYLDKVSYFVSEPDNGIYDAMNKGINVATGDVVGIINSDDWYADGAVKVVAEYFNNNDVDYIYGNLIVVNQFGDEFLLNGIEASNENTGTWYDHPTMFVKREIYMKYGMFDLQYQIFADVDFMLRLRYYNLKHANIHRVIAYFRLGGISNSGKYIRKIYTEGKIVLANFKDKYYDSIDKQKEIERKLLLWKKENVEKYLKMHFINSGNTYDVFSIILKKYKKKKFVLWGAGLDGNDVLENFIKSTNLISFIVDSDIRKQNKSICGIKITKPDKLVLKDNLIIVSSGNYFTEIKSMLEELKYVYKKDFLSYGDFKKEYLYKDAVK